LIQKEKNKLPDELRGRSIEKKVIPTVCNLKNMINRLVDLGGDTSQLKQWEKRSYKAYLTDGIKNRILLSQPELWKDIIRGHILSCRPVDLSASVIDIYLVAYVAENYGLGKERFYKYIKDHGISDKDNSAQAIWQVGKGDGIYLGILNEDGSVKDWNFMRCWIEGLL